MKQAYGMAATTDESAARSRAMDGDLRFKMAMLAARKAKQEHFAIGVDTVPGTECPAFVTPLAALTSHNASPGALCSDLGSGAARGRHTSYSGA